MNRQLPDDPGPFIASVDEVASLRREIAARDLDVAKLKRELRFARYFEIADEAVSSMCAGLEEATAGYPALYSIVDDTLNNLHQFQRQRDEARARLSVLDAAYKALEGYEACWYNGPYGFVLRDIVALPKPVPCKGALGFWTLSADVEREVRIQLPCDAGGMHVRPGGDVQCSKCLAEIRS